jgi:hypothetical protein
MAVRLSALRAGRDNSRYSSKNFVEISGLMNVLDMEADIVPSLARDHPHTHEPIASRTPPKALASQTGLDRARIVEPHTETSLAHWDPSRARLVRVWAPLDRAANVIGQ